LNQLKFENKNIDNLTEQKNKNNTEILVLHKLESNTDKWISCSIWHNKQKSAAIQFGMQSRNCKLQDIWFNQ